MGYATQEDIEELYGPDLLVRVGDYNKDVQPDDDVIENGLQNADDVCNAYLSANYSVPVTPPPGVIRTCAIDIAVYKMALGRSSRTDEMRIRYEDALALLDKISKGTVGLGLPPVTSTTTDANGNPVTTTIDPNV